MEILQKQNQETSSNIFFVEREYLGKYSPEEFVKRIIISHLESKEMPQEVAV